MKAYRLHAVGDLRLENIARPEVEPGWSLVRVAVAGICSSDVPRVFERGTYRFPTVPGHEFSGIVEAVGGAADSRWVGKRAGVFPLIPCRECEPCKAGRFELCRNYDYLGSRRDGGFSDYCAVPVWNLIELPESVSLEQGAMMEPLAVALHAAKKLGKLAGKSVAVVGSGLIGFAVAQWARVLGASRAVVVARSESKRSYAEACKVEYVSNGDSPRLLGRFDCVVEAVGTSSSVACALGLARAGATVVLIGNPAEDISLPQDAFWRILRKELVVRGTWNSSYKCGGTSDWSEVADALASKLVTVDGLVSHRLKADELPAGLRLMREHSEPYCKIVTLWE